MLLKVDTARELLPADCLLLGQPGPRETCGGRFDGVLPMTGLEHSRRLIEEGVRVWQAFVEAPS